MMLRCKWKSKLMNPVQLDLFAEEQGAASAAPASPPRLNGMYYERSTDKFVSYVLGERYYEEPAKGCGHPREWQDRIRKERAI